MSIPPYPLKTAAWVTSVVAVTACCLAPAADAATRPRQRAIQGVDVQDVANAALALMTYTVAPDVTTSSLSISNAATANPSMQITQFGGGFTWSRETPIYLEGNAAYMRYDPVFVATDGEETRSVPTKWNGFSATGGIGWDFRIAEYWVVRPIFNFTLGYITSDLEIAKWYIENETNIDLSFINGGSLHAAGVGGSLMLDFEDYKPERELDMELRYTLVELRGHGSSSEAVRGTAQASTVNLWARYRAPTPWRAMDRPVRYVLEVAHSTFLNDQAKAIGFDQMNSVGIGIELDSSKYDIWATRWRAVLRHVFAPGVSGNSVGLAISF